MLPIKYHKIYDLLSRLARLFKWHRWPGRGKALRAKPNTIMILLPNVSREKRDFPLRGLSNDTLCDPFSLSICNIFFFRFSSSTPFFCANFILFKFIVGDFIKRFSVNILTLKLMASQMQSYFLKQGS